MDEFVVKKEIGDMLAHDLLGRVAGTLKHRGADHGNNALSIHTAINILQVLKDSPEHFFALSKGNLGLLATCHVPGNTGYLFNHASGVEDGVEVKFKPHFGAIARVQLHFKVLQLTPKRLSVPVFEVSAVLGPYQSPAQFFGTDVQGRDGIDLGFHQIGIVAVERGQLHTFIDRPDQVRATVKNSIEAGGVLAEVFFTLLPGDSQGHLTRNEFEQFQITGIVGIGIVVRFYADDSRDAVTDAQRDAQQYLRRSTIEVQTVGFGQLLDVPLVQEQRSVGRDGVLGEAVAQAAFGEAQVSLEILIHIVGKVQEAFGLVVEGDEKILDVDNFS